MNWRDIGGGGEAVQAWSLDTLGAISWLRRPNNWGCVPAIQLAGDCGADWSLVLADRSFWRGLSRRSARGAATNVACVGCCLGRLLLPVRAQFALPVGMVNALPIAALARCAHLRGTGTPAQDSFAHFQICSEFSSMSPSLETCSHVRTDFHASAGQTVPSVAKFV